MRAISTIQERSRSHQSHRSPCGSRLLGNNRFHQDIGSGLLCRGHSHPFFFREGERWWLLWPSIHSSFWEGEGLATVAIDTLLLPRGGRWWWPQPSIHSFLLERSGIVVGPTHTKYFRRRAKEGLACPYFCLLDATRQGPPPAYPGKMEGSVAMAIHFSRRYRPRKMRSVGGHPLFFSVWGNIRWLIFHQLAMATSSLLPFGYKME